MFRYSMSALLLCIFAGTFFYFYTRSTSTTPLLLQHGIFVEGMGISSMGKSFVLRHEADRKLYNSSINFLKQARKARKEARSSSIPLMIHSIWLSDQPWSEEIDQAQAAVRKVNPDFQYTVWTLSDIKALLSSEELSFFVSLPPIVQSDVAALFVLLHKGGIVIDPAIFGLSSFREIASLSDWIISFEPPLSHSYMSRRLWVSPAFMSASAGHPLTKEWLVLIEKHFQANVERSIDSKKLYCEGILLPLMDLLVQERMHEYAILVLPPTCFMPLCPQYVYHYLQKLKGERSKDEKDFFSFKIMPPFSKIARESLGVHIWGGRFGQMIVQEKEERKKRFAEKAPLLRK